MADELQVKHEVKMGLLREQHEKELGEVKHDLSTARSSIAFWKSAATLKFADFEEIRAKAMKAKAHDEQTAQALKAAKACFIARGGHSHV